MRSGRGGGGEREELHHHHGGRRIFEWPGKTMMEDKACAAATADSRQAWLLSSRLEPDFLIWPLVCSNVLVRVHTELGRAGLLSGPTGPDLQKIHLFPFLLKIGNSFFD